MKRTFLARRNALLSSANVSWGSVALAVAIALVILRMLSPHLFWQALTPLFMASDTLADLTHTVLGGFADASALRLQNEKLAGENEALLTEKGALETKLAEIAGLARDASRIVAGVVARPPESPYDTLVINAGSIEGVREGMEVFGAGGVPLGTIGAVTADISYVALFSTPGRSVLGVVGPTHAPIIVTGAGAGAFIASAPRSAGVVRGATLYLPGPGHLPAGTVVRVDSDPASSPSVTLRIEPLLNLFSIAWVSVRDTGVSPKGALASSTPGQP